MREDYIPALAQTYLEQARQDPSNPLSLYARANEHRDRGDVNGWRQAIEAAFRLPHHTFNQRYQRALAMLAIGDWSGWSECASRARMPGELFDRPIVFNWIEWLYELWDGVEDVHDKTLLVLPEQGLGNNIQMLRFLPVLADKARSVIAMVYAHLVPLVQCNFSNVELAIYGVDKPLSFDRYVPILSLAGVFSLPDFRPLASPRRRPPLPRRTRPLRAGLCWAGNSGHPNDERRSMPAEHLAPLLEHEDIEWHSLQVGARANDGDRYPQLRRPWPPLITCGDTADLIVELDVVVTVDTAVAHLSGSLGVPTYLLLASRPDSRWAFGDRTPWYPHMRLLRQNHQGDWAGIIHAVRQELDHATLEASSCRAPRELSADLTLKRDLAASCTEHQV